MQQPPAHAGDADAVLPTSVQRLSGTASSTPPQTVQVTPSTASLSDLKSALLARGASQPLPCDDGLEAPPLQDEGSGDLAYDFDYHADMVHAFVLVAAWSATVATYSRIACELLAQHDGYLCKVRPQLQGDAWGRRTLCVLL